jgi:protein-tyrosine-phosphatase
MNVNVVSVDSVGVNTLEGVPVTIGSEKMATAYGVDLSEHRLKSLASIKGEKFDVIFIMERDHKKAVREFGKVILELGLFNDYGKETYYIQDPMGKTEDKMSLIYREMLIPLHNLQEVLRFRG